jgi:hypothetical protein
MQRVLSMSGAVAKWAQDTVRASVVIVRVVNVDKAPVRAITYLTACAHPLTFDYTSCPRIICIFVAIMSGESDLPICLS